MQQLRPGDHILLGTSEAYLQCPGWLFLHSLWLPGGNRRLAEAGFDLPMSERRPAGIIFVGLVGQ